MPGAPRLSSIMVDTPDPERLARFWEALLGVGRRFEADGYIWLEPQREGGSSLAFQPVAEPTPGKNRLHLDLGHDDLEGVTARVAELGGSVVEDHEVEGFVWRVFADPDGNLFCVGHEH